MPAFPYVSLMLQFSMFVQKSWFDSGHTAFWVLPILNDVAPRVGLPQAELTRVTLERVDSAGGDLGIQIVRVTLDPGHTERKSTRLNSSQQ